MNADHAAALRSSIVEHERLIGARRYAEAITQDDRFHQAIAMIAGLPRLWRMVEIAKGPIDRCRLTMLPREGRRRRRSTSIAPFWPRSKAAILNAPRPPWVSISIALMPARRCFWTACRSTAS